MSKIKDFKEGELIKGLYLVNNVTKGKASNGKDYLNIKLQDDSGEIDCKLWGAKPEELTNIVNGIVLEVEANIIKYREVLQMKIEKNKIVALEEVDLSQFVKSAPIDKNDLRIMLQKYIDEINDNTINYIVSNMVTTFEQAIIDFPAATRNHHAYHSGLIYHIVSMLKLAEAMVGLYPALNKDYLYAGVILHDLGKVEELSGALASEYTFKGKLLGHISILSAKIASLAQAIDAENSEQVIILQHLVLSHHGKLEYGSPVLPMTREAEMLTFIDNIDARMDTLNRVYENVEPGNFTARVFALENRSFYKIKE